MAAPVQKVYLEAHLVVLTERRGHSRLHSDPEAEVDHVE